MVWHEGSSAGSYLADPTSPIPSHCAVIILFKSVLVHQLPWIAPEELIQDIKLYTNTITPTGENLSTNVQYGWSGNE